MTTLEIRAMRAREFVSMVARLSTTEDIAQDGEPVPDMESTETLDGLIEQARRILK